MNQIMRVGSGIILATEWKMSDAVAFHLREVWQEHLPDVPMVILSETRIIEGSEDRPLMFSFTGDVSPTVVAEFQRWWKEVSDG